MSKIIFDSANANRYEIVRKAYGRFMIMFDGKMIKETGTMTAASNHVIMKCTKIITI